MVFFDSKCACAEHLFLKHHAFGHENDAKLVQLVGFHVKVEVYWPEKSNLSYDR